MNDGHTGHESGVEACHHAAQNYDHAMHNLSSHAGGMIDSIFGNNHHHASVGDVAHDAMNVYSADKAMNTVCGFGGSSSE